MGFSGVSFQHEYQRWLYHLIDEEGKTVQSWFNQSFPQHSVTEYLDRARALKRQGIKTDPWPSKTDLKARERERVSSFC